MAEEDTPQPEQVSPDEQPQAEAPTGGEQEATKPEAVETPATDSEPVAETDEEQAGASGEAEAFEGNEVAAGDPEGNPLDLPTFEPADYESDEAKIAFLSDVNLKVKVELGRTRMYVEDVLRLTPGSVVELDKPAGDPVDIYINDRHVARGEVLVVNENFCVRINEILQQVTVDA